ncbi:MAG: phosphotransferase [Acidobacteria bacterium]|nr:phosphotransferase [Acidobacteriota bacterium]
MGDVLGRPIARRARLSSLNEPAIVHRDIKPQNLKLTENNNVVLLDFGLSRKGAAKLRAARDLRVSPSPTRRLSRSAAPKPTREAIFFVLRDALLSLTNVVPPDATQRADAVLSGRPDPLRPISQINPEVPASVSEVIQKGMAVSQDQRFADARSMQKTLTRGVRADERGDFRRRPS